jgi:DNA replication protein DnaC
MSRMIDRKDRKKLDAEDYRRMNLPRRLHSPSWRRVPEAAKEKVQNFCVNALRDKTEGLSLVMVGEDGVGKSMISAFMLVYARQHRLSCYYTSVYDWREDRREGKTFDGMQSVDGRMREVDVLVMDDCNKSVLFSSGGASYWYEQLQALVSRRTIRGLITVLVCKYDGSNPVLRWAAGKMDHCVGIRIEGPNQHQQENQALGARVFAKPKKG